MVRLAQNRLKLGSDTLTYVIKGLDQVKTIVSPVSAGAPRNPSLWILADIDPIDYEPEDGLPRTADRVVRLPGKWPKLSSGLPFIRNKWARPAQKNRLSSLSWGPQRPQILDSCRYLPYWPPTRRWLASGHRPGAAITRNMANFYVCRDFLLSKMVRPPQRNRLPSLCWGPQRPQVLDSGSQLPQRQTSKR